MKLISLCVAIAIAFCASNVQISAQPAGLYLIGTSHNFLNCNSSVYNIELQRMGPAYTCRLYNGQTDVWSYETCNATHTIRYTCSNANCTTDCQFLEEYTIGECSDSNRQVCFNPPAPSFLPQLLGQYSLTRNFPVFMQFQSSQDPTCDLSSDSFAFAEVSGVPTCSPYTNGKFAYSTCNSTGTYTFACDDNECTQNCFIAEQGQLRECSGPGEFPSKTICVVPQATPAPALNPVAQPALAPQASSASPVSPVPVAAPQGAATPQAAAAPTSTSTPSAVASPTAVSAPQQKAPAAAASTPRSAASEHSSMLLMLSLAAVALAVLFAL